MIARVRAGEPEAYAEDVVQQAFVKAYCALGRFRDGAGCGGRRVVAGAALALVLRPYVTRLPLTRRGKDAPGPRQELLDA